MNSFSLPKPLFQSLSWRRVPAARHATVLTEGQKMIKVCGWAVTILAASLLAWQILGDATIWPKSISVLLLVLISGLAGLRIGSLGAMAYINDVHRLNKVLAEQHRGLEDVNAMLLKQINTEVESPASAEQL